MRLFATGLAERGVDVVTFNFLYTERAARFLIPRRDLKAVTGRSSMPRSSTKS